MCRVRVAVTAPRAPLAGRPDRDRRRRRPRPRPGQVRGGPVRAAVLHPPAVLGRVRPSPIRGATSPAAPSYYEVESWRYLPHDSELPRALVRLRAHTDQIDYLREQLERAFAGADAASAAL